MARRVPHGREAWCGWPASCRRIQGQFGLFIPPEQEPVQVAWVGWLRREDHLQQCVCRHDTADRQAGVAVAAELSREEDPGLRVSGVPGDDPLKRQDVRDPPGAIVVGPGSQIRIEGVDVHPFVRADRPDILQVDCDLDESTGLDSSAIQEIASPQKAMAQWLSSVAASRNERAASSLESPMSKATPCWTNCRARGLFVVAGKSVCPTSSRTNARRVESCSEIST